MADTKQTGTGTIALLVGVALGALGMWAAQKTVLSEDNVLDFDTSTLVDSLEGLSIDGVEADLVKVRILGLERAKMVAMWGSKGLNGDEPTKFQRLRDLTTEHLLNIKSNSQKVTPDERRLIDSILEDRVVSGF